MEFRIGSQIFPKQDFFDALASLSPEDRKEIALHIFSTLMENIEDAKTAYERSVLEKAVEAKRSLESLYDVFPSWVSNKRK